MWPDVKVYYTMGNASVSQTLKGNCSPNVTCGHMHVHMCMCGGTLLVGTSQISTKE
jgi:hypothetical protein